VSKTSVDDQEEVTSRRSYVASINGVSSQNRRVKSFFLFFSIIDCYMLVSSIISDKLYTTAHVLRSDELSGNCQDPALDGTPASPSSSSS
jgi:hypothetical protein